MLKRFGSIVLIISIFACCMVTNGYAAALNTYEYTNAYGDTIVYQVDKQGNPYVMIDGEKVHVLLGREEDLVTDQKMIDFLNAGLALSESPQGEKSPPTNYFELSILNGANTSIVYEKQIYLPSTYGAWSDYFKFSSDHNSLRIHTASVNGGWPLHRISIDFYYYDNSFDRWYCDSRSAVNCTDDDGYPMGLIMSAYPFGRLWLYQYDSVTSFNLQAWSTYVTFIV